jgi:hypothetical protein
MEILGTEGQTLLGELVDDAVPALVLGALPVGRAAQGTPPTSFDL